MRKSQIAAQLYSFRDFIKTPEGVADTFRILHEMGYGAVQLSSSLAKMPEEEEIPEAKRKLRTRQFNRRYHIEPTLTYNSPPLSIIHLKNAR